MPRPPSIRLRLSRVLVTSLSRVEAVLEQPGRVLDVKETQALVNLAKADALIRDRGTSREEEEDAEQSEQQREKKARELVALIRQQNTQGPAAVEHRSGGDDDAEP